jgi:hypothetical protein
MNKPLFKRIPALYNKHGSLKAVWRTGKYGGWGKVQSAYRKAVEEGLIEHVALGAKPNTHTKLQPSERAKTFKTQTARHKAYILTCAQNNTLVNAGTWENLKAYAKYLGAEIYVSTFLYANRSHWQKNLDKGRVTKGAKGDDGLWFDPAIMPYVNNDRVQIAPGIVWCGELNISPTAASPLSGLEVYTGRQSMIVPHTKVELQSIATVGGSGAKLNYTTGTVTLRNYIQRKEGFKAEFHHCYGGLLVEVDDDGHWWVRQLACETDGTFYDLDRKVENGKVTTGHRVEAITFGDAHVDEIDNAVAEATWGAGGMVDQLRPRFQFIHDVLDFHSRSHHRMKDPYAVYQRFVEGRDSVQREVEGVAEFLRWIKRPDCQTVIVPSNHDRHISRWLADNDGRKDPPNARFWSLLNSAVIKHIAERDEQPDTLKLAVELVAPNVANDEANYFLPLDTSFVICPEEGGGIECGLHFDLGNNGARGTLGQFAKMGRRANGGHSHSSGIKGGAYQTGAKIKLRQEYNHGPSSWSHSDIITYANSKRAIITFYTSEGRSKWRA